ncbi:MAG: hypothetical protein K8F60_01235 [Melioribacteraceae bacterium]|nr:hypothetical protein [Melioribacteraceae bacterium]
MKMLLLAYNSYKKNSPELFLISRLSKTIIQIGYIGMECRVYPTYFNFDEAT